MRVFLAILALSAATACTKGADVGSRRAAATEQASSTASGSDTGAVADGSVSGAIADADFTPALEPVSVSGTNLTGETAAVRVAVSAYDPASGAWREVGSHPVNAGLFQLGVLPRDAYLAFRAGKWGAILPPLGASALSAVLGPAATEALALFVAVAAEPACRTLLVDRALDLPALWELGAVIAAAVRNGGKAPDRAAFAASFCRANGAAAAKLGAGAARAAVAAAAAVAASAQVLAQVAAGTYDARLAAKAAGSGLETARETLALTVASVGGAGDVERTFVYFRTLAAGGESPAVVRAKVYALTPEEMRGQFEGGKAEAEQVAVVLGKVNEDSSAGAGASASTSAGSSTTTITTTTTTATTATTTTAAEETTTTTVPPPVNTPPTLTGVSNQSILQNQSTGILSVTIGDAETDAGSLTFSAIATDTALVPAGGITLGGTGAARTLRLTPAANHYGSTLVTMTVSDGESTASKSFTLTVAHVNQRPTISTVSPQTIAEDGTTGALAFSVGDGETAAGALMVSATSSDTGLFVVGGISFGGSGAARTVTVVPVHDATGTATITLHVDDGTDQTTSTFAVTVTPVNDAPTISDVANKTTTQNTDAGPYAFTVADADTPLSGLSVQATSSNQAIVADSGIALGGSAGNRTVTVTPVHDATGTVTITLSVSDGAGSASDDFQLTISSPGQGSGANRGLQVGLSAYYSLESYTTALGYDVYPDMAGDTDVKTNSSQVHQGNSDPVQGKYIESTTVGLHASSPVISSGAMSLSAWFKVSGSPNAAGIFVIDQSNSGDVVKQFIGLDEQNKVKASFDGVHVMHSVTAVNTEVWHLAVATYDATTRNQMLFLDGNPAGMINGPADFMGANGIDVANLGANTAGQTLRVDEVGIWRRVLDEEDVKELYGDGFPPAFPLTSLKASLLGYYPFDGTQEQLGNEASTGVWGLNSTFTPEVLATGVHGQAAHCIGSEHSEFTAPSGLTDVLQTSGDENSFAFSAWLSGQQSYTAGTNFVMRPLAVYDGTNLLRQISFQTATSAFMRFDSTNADDLSVNTGTSFDSTQFHHFVYVYNGHTHAAKAYVDGALVGFNNLSGLDWEPLGFAGAKMHICSYSASDLNAVSMAIDEMGLWTRPLSAAEVQLLYNSGASLPFASF